MSQEAMKSRKEIAGLKYAGDPVCQTGREGIQRTEQTGGPAWPTARENTGNPDCSGTGMTLRDYFAAAALSNSYTSSERAPEDVAKWAYQVADEMLKARVEG